MHSWWYAGLMFAGYLLLMEGVRWLARKIGPRLPQRWQPMLTTSTASPDRSRAKRVAGIGILLTIAVYAVLFLWGKHLGLN